MSEIYLDIKVLTGLRVRFKSPDYKRLTIVATNPWTGEVYTGEVDEEQEFHVNIHYPTPWKVEFFDKGDKLTCVDLNYEGGNVGIRFATEALGDTLAWVPVVEEWMKKVKPANVYIYTKWNRLFDKSKYPSNLHWVENPDEEFSKLPLNLFHVLGISRLHGESLNPRDNHATVVNWQDCNMIDCQNFTFGLSLEERRPKLVPLSDSRPFPEKYITICPSASQKIKHWLNPRGWAMLCRACQQAGYRVLVVGNTPTYLPGVDNAISDDIYQAMYLIKHADFHIGLSSGLSWMAWAFNKPVLMLGDFTHEGYEFSTNIIRAYSGSEQAGVFNNTKVKWIPTWELDPYEDDYKLARDFSLDHALKALSVMLNIAQSGQRIDKGIVVLPTGECRPITKLMPNELPKSYLNN